MSILPANERDRPGIPSPSRTGPVDFAAIESATLRNLISMVENMAKRYRPVLTSGIFFFGKVIVIKKNA